VARHHDQQERKKVWERRLVDAFLQDFGSDGAGWTCVEPDREKPDFIYERLGHRVGIEITELLTPESGRERAGEREVAGVIHDVLAGVLREHGGRGAVVDAHLMTLPRRRVEATEVARQFEEHLRRHGAPLAQDHGIITVPFNFEWGVVSRVQRQDALGTVFIMREQNAHRTALTDRDPALIEHRLIEAVGEKVRKAHEYDRTHPVWLILRNPYTHLSGISEALRRELVGANAGLFERVYCHNLKMNSLDASPPAPVVVRVV